MFQFVLTLLTTVVLIPAMFVMPESGLGRFYHSAWFWIPGGILLAVGLFAALMGLGRRRWSSLVAHLGVVMLFIGLLRETQAIDGIVTVREGESATTLRTGKPENELPLGFELALVSFQEQGYVSRVRINNLSNHGLTPMNTGSTGFDSGRVHPCSSVVVKEARIAPSHPTSTHGWLILQEGFDRDTAQGWLRLVTESGDTLRANLSERVFLPGTSLEILFDLNAAQTRDTMFRFRLFENGVEKPSGFVFRKGVIPPSMKLGLRLVDFETGRKYVSILRVVKRPGAGLVFFAFAVLLAGVLMFALEPKRETIGDRR